MVPRLSALSMPYCCRRLSVHTSVIRDCCDSNIRVVVVVFLFMIFLAKRIEIPVRSASKLLQLHFDRTTFVVSVFKLLRYQEKKKEEK